MKHVAGIAIALALLTGASLLAVETFDDRALFVPPPDAVAEAFTREVLTRRYDRANSYLATPVQREELEQLRQRLGESENVESEIVEQDRARASARITLKSARFVLSLVWEKGEWKVAALP